MVKLICTDVDGTLLNKQRQVDDFTIEVFAQLDKSIRIILASSRMPKALWHIQKSLNIEHMPLICYNGALVLASGSTFDLEKVIASITIPAKIVLDLIGLASLHSVHISIFYNNTWLASKIDFYAQREINNTQVRPDGLLSDFSAEELNTFIAQGAHKIMLMGNPELLDIIEKSLITNTEVSIWRSKDIYLEITPPTNKSDGLAALLKMPEYADITLQDSMAFGDGYNDLELISNVKFGVAVANGVPAIQEIAYAITKSNIENGVAYYLDASFNGKNL